MRNAPKMDMHLAMCFGSLLNTTLPCSQKEDFRFVAAPSKFYLDSLEVAAALTWQALHCNQGLLADRGGTRRPLHNTMSSCRAMRNVSKTPSTAGCPLSPCDYRPVVAPSAEKGSCPGNRGMQLDIVSAGKLQSTELPAMAVLHCCIESTPPYIDQTTWDASKEGDYS